MTDDAELRLSEAPLVAILNEYVQRIAARADRADASYLAKTFVDIPYVTSGLQSHDHGIIYGRRGTGKTHALTNLSQAVELDGNLSLLIDLRRIGSNSGLYADGAEDYQHRASKLLVDLVEEIHNGLRARALETSGRWSHLLSGLDALGESATSVRVEGPVDLTVETEAGEKDTRERGGDASLKSSGGVSAGLRAKDSQTRDSRRRSSDKRSGLELPRIHFGQMARAVNSIGELASPHRIWILLDEWSSVPPDLQPVLADMLRRSFFTTPSVTVKISAIERRTTFIKRAGDNTYVGIEVGADTNAAINLDEHLRSFSSSEALSFHAEVLNRHLEVGTEDVGLEWGFGVNWVIEEMFDSSSFASLMHSAEGVPRDMIHILARAASFARSGKIGKTHIAEAARSYFLRDKERAIAGNRRAISLWNRIQREIVHSAHASVFLLKRPRIGSPSDKMADLHDARLVHFLYRGLSIGADLYDAYSIDYGAYVTTLGEDVHASPWNANEEVNFIKTCQVLSLSRPR